MVTALPLNGLSGRGSCNDDELAFGPLSYREGEIVVGIGLVPEGEMPPLDGDGFEPVTHHGFA